MRPPFTSQVNQESKTASDRDESGRRVERWPICKWKHSTRLSSLRNPTEIILDFFLL